MAKQPVLNAMEKAFVAEYVATGNGPYAARQAGYAHPPQAARNNLVKPTIDAAIRAATLAELHNELRPLALRHCRRVLEDEKAPIRDKTMVAKIVLDRTEASPDGPAGKDMAEMSADELHALLDRARDLVAAKARDVTPRPAPEPAPSSVEPAEIDPFG